MSRTSTEHILSAIWAMSLIAALSHAYTGIIAPDPANPDKCIYRGDTLEPGVTLGVAPCQRLTCNEDASILIEGCGKLRIENCNRGERLNSGKPYPECCKLRYKCKQSDGSSYFIEKDVSDEGLDKGIVAVSNKTENSA